MIDWTLYRASPQYKPRGTAYELNVMVKGIYINEIIEFLLPAEGIRESSTTAVMGIYKITNR